MDNIPAMWVIEQQIREVAYLKWEQAGCPVEMSLRFWLEAENEVWSQYGDSKDK